MLCFVKGFLLTRLDPAGRLLAAVLPDWGFQFMGARYSLNPGPFNYKARNQTYRKWELD